MQRAIRHKYGSHFSFWAFIVTFGVWGFSKPNNSDFLYLKADNNSESYFGEQRNQPEESVVEDCTEVVYISWDKVT